MRRVCIAIGVSRAEGLTPLRAAATAAEEVGEWAELSGFADPADIEVLTDRDVPVTIERIAGAFGRLLPMGQATDALLLHFAGHGLREDNTRTLWLPTNWRTELRAIAVERLKNRLSDFGIANVTIISDACKALANDRDTSDLTPDGVLGAGTSAGVRPIFDRYDAVHDVESAFMVPGAKPEGSRCIFSGALMEALWGATTALDEHYPGKVTPGSLADHLSTRVEELCAIYQLSCEPQCLPGRPADHLIYFDQGAVDPAQIPALPAWPAPISVAQPQPLAPGALSRKERRRIETSILGRKIGNTNPDISTFDRGLGLPDLTRRRLDNWVDKIAVAPDSTEALSSTEIDWLKGKARGEVEGSLVAARQQERRRASISAFGEVVLPETPANLLFASVTPVAVWSRARVQQIGLNQWQASDSASEQLLVEYDDDIFLPVVVYPDLTTVVVRDNQGANGWLFRSRYEMSSSNRASADILARMQSNDLPPSDVDEVAAVMRHSKHGDPMLGAICAYLYDYSGDLDNIRRMAYFYALNGQPIPYDIALMGELATRSLDRPGYSAEVPAVAKRAREPDSDLPNFVTRATKATSGNVGGLCPWLRQGWDFVEAPTDREAPLVQGLPDVRRHLLPETFTSFDDEGGRILVDHWNMERWV